MLKIKRVYEKPEPEDGIRILVDRLWPRGLSKENAKVDEWRKDLAPSDDLRKWFAHDPAKWEEFRARYRRELESLGEVEELKRIVSQSHHENVTLVFAASDSEHSNAEYLRELAASI